MDVVVAFQHYTYSLNFEGKEIISETMYSLYKNPKTFGNIRVAQMAKLITA